MGESSGPIANGITYIVRPFMQPLNFSSMTFFISAASAQLFVGPASSFVLEQMNVRSSTRATSLGCERARYEPGRFCALSLMNVPFLTIKSQSVWFSASEPSHQKIFSGWHSAAISSTQDINFWWFVFFSPSVRVIKFQIGCRRKFSSERARNLPEKKIFAAKILACPCYDLAKMFNKIINHAVSSGL